MYNALETEMDRVHSFFGVWNGMTRENNEIEKEIGTRRLGVYFLQLLLFLYLSLSAFMMK